MQTYEVACQHYGDKQYWPGDTREANAADVQHLIKAGVLLEPEAKAETKTANKAAPPVKNKAGG